MAILLQLEEVKTTQQNFSKGKNFQIYKKYLKLNICSLHNKGYVEKDGTVQCIKNGLISLEFIIRCNVLMHF